MAGRTQQVPVETIENALITILTVEHCALLKNGMRLGPAGADERRGTNPLPGGLGTFRLREQGRGHAVDPMYAECERRPEEAASALLWRELRSDVINRQATFGRERCDKTSRERVVRRQVVAFLGSGCAYECAYGLVSTRHFMPQLVAAWN